MGREQVAWDLEGHHKDSGSILQERVDGKPPQSFKQNDNDLFFFFFNDSSNCWVENRL